MNLLQKIQADLDAGFTKSDLERLIGLPRNSLTEILKGKRFLSKKAIIKVEKFMASPKPDPLDLPPVEKKLPTHKKVPIDNGIQGKVFQGKKEIEIPKINYTTSNEQLNASQRRLGADIEPEEGTNRFFLKYGAFTHAEAKKLKK